MSSEQDKLISLDKDKLTYHRQGVLWVKGTPTYIVDLVKEGDLSYVIVFKADPTEKTNPRKFAVEQVVGQEQYKNTTWLGQLANSLFPARKVRKWIPKPPLFVAPVVPNQVDTFTGKRESGFFEREEDQVSTIAGERHYIRGKNTGVFVGLSSIDWDDKYTIPTESLVSALIQYRQGDGFYDFSGNNNDQSNPLGSNYQGGN